MSMHSIFSPQELLTKLPHDGDAIDLSKLIKMPVGSTHHIYRMPENPNILVKVVIDSIGEDPNTQELKVSDLTSKYAKLHGVFGIDRCLVESRFISKIKDPQFFTEALSAIVSIVSFDHCFQSEHKFGFNTEAVECHEIKLREHLSQYHAMNSALLGKDKEGSFNENDFLIFHESFRPIFARLDSDPAFVEVMREFLMKFKKYYDETGQLLDFIGDNNVLFYKDESGAWQYKVGAVIKKETQENAVRMLREINTNPSVVKDSFEDWTYIFFVPSNLRIVNATAAKLGMNKVIDNIPVSTKDSANLSKMYNHLSLYERAFYCFNDPELSFEESIFNLTQFILENKDKALFVENKEVTKIIIDRMVDTLIERQSASLDHKSQEMLAIVKDLHNSDQLQCAKKLSLLSELGLDVGKLVSLSNIREGSLEIPKGDGTVVEKRKNYIIIKASAGQTKNKETSLSDDATSMAQEQTNDSNQPTNKSPK